jgi:hypothetical protein
MPTHASRTFLLALPCALLIAALAASCGGESAGSGGSGSGGSGGSQGAGSATACGAKVTIAFFSDASCSEASKVGQRAYDTSLDCFSWTAKGSNAEENSATRFQCYDDRLCYTQHPDTLTCAGGAIGATDKQAKNGECVKEPAGQLYSKIVGGNEGCPPPPAGFECPASEAGMGTDGIVACTASP